MEREPGSRGFAVQPRRWLVEHCFAWLSLNRRMAKDYERTVQTSEPLIELVAIRLLLRHLASTTTTARSETRRRSGTSAGHLL